VRQILPNTLRRPSDAQLRVRTFFEWHLKKSHETIVDLIYGVDTFKWALDPVRNTSTRFVYDAAPWSALRRSFKHLSLDFSRFTFVDMGCGKGRIVLAASAFPFARVIGVEFSPPLCRVAESNLATCRGLRRRAQTTQIIECDATEFAVPSSPCVFFFYNPFSFEILETAIQNINDSYGLYPREIYLILVGMSTVFPQVILIPGVNLLCSSSIPFTVLNHRSLYIFAVTGK
jgi:SAM-dependent methyltransferase